MSKEKAMTVTASVTIDAPPETVWDALTDRETIEEYFFGAEVDTDWTEGSSIRFKGGWEGESYEDDGEIERFESSSILEFSHWSPLSGDPPAPENYHTVRYELSAVDGGTELTLTYDRDDAVAAGDHLEMGWQTILTNLKEYLEEGIHHE